MQRSDLKILKERENMGREVRRVPKNWQHPKDKNQKPIPLLEEDVPNGNFYQMYETCSEGTPISPIMETPEELARWLSDHNASAFGSMTATYEQWLCTIYRGGSCSCYITSTGNIKSGVEMCERKSDQE